MTYTIYTLSCEKSNQVFYIGITTISLESRLLNHLVASKRNDNPIYQYIREVSQQPVIEEVETFEVDSKIIALTIEQYWIDQFRQWGFRLYNSSHNLAKKIKFFAKEKMQTSANVRFSDESHSIIKEYCERKGYKLSAFCERAVIERMEKELLHS